jgi:hypothetical protein
MILAFSGDPKQVVSSGIFPGSMLVECNLYLARSCTDWNIHHPDAHIAVVCVPAAPAGRYGPRTNRGSQRRVASGPLNQKPTGNKMQGDGRVDRRT